FLNPQFYAMVTVLMSVVIHVFLVVRLVKPVDQAGQRLTILWIKLSVFDTYVF
ncbi:3490_t:CDS:2, partial [Acaulospora morrowiae]